MQTPRYRAAQLTLGPPHIRDAFDLRRLSRTLLAALMPALAVGIYNSGYQVGRAAELLGADAPSSWQGRLLALTGWPPDPTSIVGSTLIGLLYLLPLLAAALLAGAAWEHAFAVVRRRRRLPGLAATALLFTLSLPPTTPPWQAAVAMSFGIVMGKEIFGGTGRNFLNPALVALVFLYFAYPDTMRAGSAWVPIDGWSAGTLLDRAAIDGIEALGVADAAWREAFLGRVPGGLGDRSVAACLLGAAILAWRRIVSWRILIGGIAGLAVGASLASWLGATPLAELPWYWHATLGSFAFGLVFFATDPVTTPYTDAGRWGYGVLIGVMVVVIRVANATHSDGVMLAILIGNVSAPLIDHFVIRASIRRRARHHRAMSDGV